MVKRLLPVVTLTMTAMLLFAGIVHAGTIDPNGNFRPELVPDNMAEPGWQDAIQAAWVIGIFIVMLIILYPTAWKKVLAGLKAREDRIRSDIAAAEDARKKAEAALETYNQRLATVQQQVTDALNKAAVDAEKIATSIKTKAQQDAEEAKERATAEIESAKRQALAEIYEQTAVLATSVAEKIIKRTLNADDQRDLVKQSLDQLGTISNN